MRISVWLVFLVIWPSGPLAAQCPDGSPPPCSRPGASPRPSRADPDVVAVLPFRVVGSGAETDFLRDGMVDLLYIHLDGFAGLKLVNPTTVIARSRANPPGDLRNAAGVARGMGAGTFITGTAIALGDQLRLLAEVYDVTTLERRTMVQLQGDPARLATMVDSLAWMLARFRLAQHPAEIRRSLEEYTTSSLPALRAYLSGEQLARASRWREAMDSLKGATNRDSLFGLAWYARYRVALWGGQGGENVQEVLVARGLRSPRLGPRQRDLLMAIQALQRGTRTEALERAQLLEERYGDDPDAALARGEILYHIGLPAGRSPREALAAFMTMVALDPRAIEGYGHAIELLCQLGEVERAWQLVATAPDPSYYTPVILAMRMAYRGESVVALQNGRDSLIARQAMGGAGFRILRILNNEPNRAVALSDSITRGIGQRFPRRDVLLHRYRFAVAQGRFKEAWQLLSQALEVESGGEVFEIQVPGRFMGEEEEAARREQFDRSAKDVPWGAQVFNAWWAAVDGDTLRADTAATLLAGYPGWPPQGYRQALGKGLRGLAHLARGDTARARALLVEGYQARYYQMGLEWSLRMPNVLFSIQLARIDLARGNLEDAARWLTDGLTHLEEELPYRADALELMGQVAERQGNVQVAARAYRSFIALWGHADPELQPRVEAAREALRRLN